MIEQLDTRWSVEGTTISTISGDYWTATSYGNHVAPDVVPALAAIRERLAAAGYEFVDEPVHVVRDERTTAGTEVSFRVSHRVLFRKGEGTLVVEVSGGGATLEEAVAKAEAYVRELRYNGAPVASGRGQAKTCLEIARRLYEAHGAWLHEKGLIVVRYHTRGGSGGWMGKVARRQFEIGDLQSAPAVGRYYCTLCGRPAPRHEQKCHWDSAKKIIWYTSGCCDAPVQRGKAPRGSAPGGR